MEEMARMRAVPSADDFEAAKKRGKLEMAAGAASVRFDRKHDAVVVTMRSGAVATIPRAFIPVVADGDRGAADDVELSPMGTSLRFPSLDADFSVHGLIRRAFGLNHVNQVAGATKSPARAAASRANGKTGGRPRTKLRSSS
jgi:hypothetical protein